MPELLLHFWEAHTVAPSLNLCPRGLCVPSFSCQRAELEPGLSGGLGRNHVERRGLQGQRLPSWRPVFGDRRLPGHVSQGVLPLLGHQRARKSRAGHGCGTWQLGLRGSPHPCAGTGRSTDPGVACLESEIHLSLPLPGAQHRRDTGALPAQGSSSPSHSFVGRRRKDPVAKAPHGVAAKLIQMQVAGML